MLIALLVVLGISGALVWHSYVVRQGANALVDALRWDGPEDLEKRLKEVEWLVDQLPQKWEEMEKKSKRAEDRARAVVRRAMEELEEAGYEHAGVEAEAQELRVQHGNGSQSPRVQPVPAEMGGGGEVPGPEGEDWERVTQNHKYGGAG